VCGWLSTVTTGCVCRAVGLRNTCLPPLRLISKGQALMYDCERGTLVRGMWQTAAQWDHRSLISHLHVKAAHHVVSAATSGVCSSVVIHFWHLSLCLCNGLPGGACHCSCSVRFVTYLDGITFSQAVALLLRLSIVGVGVAASGTAVSQLHGAATCVQLQFRRCKNGCVLSGWMPALPPCCGWS
jgi:hypothetical protein